ncbi:MAG TPA: hypothetical protein VLH84_03170 [Patescibacteria group bacterium]|nr:hypothetical protein [Patescibacteria group bacterium]
MTNYSALVAETFLATPPSEFGDAHTTTAEFAALRALYLERGGSREATIASIVENGYPTPDEVTADMVALSGAAHACGVAIDLAETRGEAGRDATYKSYGVKNRFDRHVARHLPTELRLAWEAPIPRQPEYENPAIVYPTGVDTRLIYGVAKPHRYFPAQTMRYLEFARLGELDPATAQEFGVTDQNRAAFGVPWDTLVPTIEAATGMVDLSAALSQQIAQSLLGNGLEPQQVAAVLRRGYSLEGMQQEHGRVRQTEQAYEALLDRLQSSDDTAPVAQLLIQ